MDWSDAEISGLGEAIGKEAAKITPTRMQDSLGMNMAMCQGPYCMLI